MIQEELLEFAEQLDIVPSSTMMLAEQVAKLPPASTDAKSIEEWASRLAADISKGSD